MHRLITSQRNQEKAEQLRQLKIKQQKIRAQRNQDEREIRDLMRDLEKRKEVSLFAPCAHRKPLAGCCEVLTP